MKALILASSLVVLITPAVGQTLPKNCEIALKNLNDQEDYIKGVMVTSKMPLVTRKVQAAGAIGFFKGNLSLLPVICPSQMFSQAEPEVRQRIDQLESFIDSGRWQGPAPEQNQ